MKCGTGLGGLRRRVKGECLVADTRELQPAQKSASCPASISACCTSAHRMRPRSERTGATAIDGWLLANGVGRSRGCCCRVWISPSPFTCVATASSPILHCSLEATTWSTRARVGWTMGEAVHSNRLREKEADRIACEWLRVWQMQHSTFECPLSPSSCPSAQTDRRRLRPVAGTTRKRKKETAQRLFKLSRQTQCSRSIISSSYDCTFIMFGGVRVALNLSCDRLVFVADLKFAVELPVSHSSPSDRSRR